MAALRVEMLELWARGAFRHARVGTGPEKQLRAEIRSDHVLWLDPGLLSPAQRAVWDAIERLRLAINAQLYLGLFEYEAHFAIYPPRAFYRRHLDMSPGALRRTVTCIVYLNDAWTSGDGGQLRIEPMTSPDAAVEPVDILPRGGQLACFLSHEVWHQVLPCERPRLSVTGWLFRRD